MDEEKTSWKPKDGGGAPARRVSVGLCNIGVYKGFYKGSMRVLYDRGINN